MDLGVPFSQTIKMGCEPPDWQKEALGEGHEMSWAATSATKRVVRPKVTRILVELK